MFSALCCRQRRQSQETESLLGDRNRSRRASQDLRNIIEQQQQQITQLQAEKDGLTQEWKDAIEKHDAEREKLTAEIEKRKTDFKQQTAERESLTADLEKQRSTLEKQTRLVTDLQDEKDGLIQNLKVAREEQTAERGKLTAELEKLRTLVEIKSTESTTLAAVVDRQRNIIEGQALEYETLLAQMKSSSQQLRQKPNLHDLLKETTDDTYMSYTIEDEEIVKKIRTLFVTHVIPGNVLHMFHHYNTNVLVQQDIEVVTSITSNYGKFHGAGELLSRLVRYEGWFSCLVQVLRDPHIKQSHVADKMWDALGMGETREKNASIDEVKEKVKTAVRTLEHIKHVVKQQQNSHVVSQDGLSCLKFILQTNFDYPNFRIEVGDHLCDTSLAEICMKILREQVTLTQLDDVNMWPVIDYTCAICRNYSADNPTFSKRLAESGTVDCITNILKERCITDNLHRERQRSVVLHSLAVLRHIAIKVGKIPEFRESKTIEVVIPLLNSNNKEVKVYAMMALIQIVEEEERDKLTDTSGVIPAIVEGLHHAVNNSQDRKYESFPAGALSQCLDKMAVCDVNRPKIVESGVLDVFVTIMRNPHPDYIEQSWATKCIYQLINDEHIKHTVLQCPDLVPALQDLKESQDKDVRYWVGKSLQLIQG